MLLQTTILEQISTKNLVKVILSETQLESNFQAILKALKSHDSFIANLISKVNNLESTTRNHESLLGKIEKQGKKPEQTSISEQAFNKLLKDASVNDQQLKKLAADIIGLKEKVNYIDDKTKGMEDDMQKNQQTVQDRLDKLEKFEGFIKKTEDRLDKIEQNVQKYDKYEERIKQLERDLQQQQDKISKLGQALLKIGKEDKGKEGKESKNQKMSDENLNKALIQLESRLNSTINEHKSNTGQEFERIYGMINDVTTSHLAKITETLNDHAKTSKKMSEDIWKLNEQLYKHQSQQPQASSGESFNIKRVTQLERKVQQLSRILSNLGHDTNNMTKNYSTAFKTPQKIDEIEWSPVPKRQNTHQRQEAKDLNQMKQESLVQEKTNFKKEIIQKLKQQKGDFNKAIKKIENINLKKEQDKQKMEEMQEKLLRIQHIINGKIDEQGMKKWMRYIQNKINYLYRIINVESPQEDACIAKKNWICLSCDKKLDAYKGKVGNHLVSAQMKGKNIEQEVIGGGMLFRSKSKYEMPTIKK